MQEIRNPLKLYFITSIFSIIFALLCFSYNVWRLQQSEQNNTIRMASFEVLTELAKFEQILYASHYDKNTIDGSPRKAWVKIGLIVDLSQLISKPVEIQAQKLHKDWEKSWEKIPNDNESVNLLVVELDNVRNEIKKQLEQLE